MHAFVADVRCFSVFQNLQFDSKEAYLIYHRSREVDWNDEASVGCFSYIGLGCDVLDIPAREITTGKRTVNDAQVKNLVGVVSIVFKFGHRKMLSEATDIFWSVIVATTDFHNQASNAPIVEDEIVEKETSWNRRDLMSKDNCKLILLQGIQGLYQTYSLSVPLDVQSVQALSKDALWTFTSAGSNEASLADLKESCAANKAEVVRSLEVTKEKLADVERLIQGSEPNRDTLHDLATKVDEVEIELKSFEDHFHFFEEKVSEQSNQLFEDNASSSWYRKLAVLLGQELVTVSADVTCLTSKHRADRKLLDGVCAALAFHKKYLQQRALAHIKDREKLLADRAVVESKFRKFWVVM